MDYALYLCTFNKINKSILLLEFISLQCHVHLHTYTTAVNVFPFAVTPQCFESTHI